MKSSNLTFAYQQLDFPADTVAKVQEHTIRIKGLQQQAIADIIETGGHLSAVKDILGHGHFGSWLRSEIGWSQDTAERWINVHRCFGQIPHDAEFQLPTQKTVVYLIANPKFPAGVRQQLLQGESIPVNGTRKTIRELQAAELRQFLPAPADEDREQKRSRVQSRTLKELEQEMGSIIETIQRLRAEWEETGGCRPSLKLCRELFTPVKRFVEPVAACVVDDLLKGRSGICDATILAMVSEAKHAEYDRFVASRSVASEGKEEDTC